MHHAHSVQELHKSLCQDPRTLELVSSLISHLHAFARETQLTHDEWAKAVKFLTRAGKESTDYKNEFVLLSDCMGLSALVDEINHPKPSVSCARRMRAGAWLIVKSGVYRWLRTGPVLH